MICKLLDHVLVSCKRIVKNRARIIRTTNKLIFNEAMPPLVHQIRSTARSQSKAVVAVIYIRPGNRFYGHDLVS